MIRAASRTQPLKPPEKAPVCCFCFCWFDVDWVRDLGGYILMEVHVLTPSMENGAALASKFEHSQNPLVLPL